MLFHLPAFFSGFLWENVMGVWRGLIGLTDDKIHWNARSSFTHLGGLIRVG